MSVRARRLGSLSIVGIAIGTTVVASLVAVLLLGLFHAPKPRDVPVAIVGQGPAVDALANGLSQSGAFSVRRVADGATARELIGDREVYGAYAPRARVGRVLVAGAAGLPMAGVLQQAFTAVDQQRNVQTVVTDVVPLPPDDVTGGSGYLIALVVALAGVIGAWLLELLSPSVRRGPVAALRRVGALVVISALAGLALALLAGGFGLYEDDTLVIAAVLALAMLGCMTITSVLTSQLGGPLGLIGGIVIFVLVGLLVTSGGTSAPEFLPDFWRAIGSALSPRAVIDVIRNTVYFDGAATATPYTVLGVHAALGITLMLALSPLRRL